MESAGIGNLGSILLARKPRITDSRNDTTASTESKDGYTMAVSFWMARPPELSLFSVYCTKDTERCSYTELPQVVGADGPFVLLRTTINGPYRRDYFLYKAGTPPSLRWIPSPSPDEDLRGEGVRVLGILGHGGGYLLAALLDAPDDDSYQLRIYSSETSSWSTKKLRNPCPGVDRVIPDKVITLVGEQEGLLGWVDLSQGLLVCNLLFLLQAQDDQDPPASAVSFIPLPDLLPGNRYKLKYPIPPTKKMKKHPMAEEEHRSVSWFRDLTYVNGVLKFIELENPTPPENKDNIVYNSDLIMSLKRKAVDCNSKQQLSSFRDAWRAVTWTQKLVSSSNFWRQTCVTHVDDIKSQLLAFRDFYSAFPILSPEDGADVLYLKCLPEPSDRNGLVVALDVGNNSLITVARYYLPDDFYYKRGYDTEHPFHACTLSRHLDTSNPGIQVSACHKITEASTSASKTPIPSKPRTTFQDIAELAGRLKRARHPPKSIIQSPHTSQVHPPQTSQVHPVLPRQQCFNKPVGPWYRSLPSWHNYQPLLSPSVHQLASSSESRPHEVPQSCVNSYHVASYYGYSQQLSTPNSVTYGAHTGYPQQLPPTLELPIGVSWHTPPPAMQPTPRE